MATAPPSSLAPGLSRKVKKVLSLKTETPELIGSLATLSEIYPENNATARRYLRSTIEGSGVKINEEFLRAADAVIQVLDVVQSDLDALSRCCAEMTAALGSGEASAAQLVHETDRLQAALAASEARSQLVGRFLEEYQLTPEEAMALQDAEISEVFFAALAHVRQIHTNCKALLRTHHQRAGLELMDTMAAHQEAAYERLCRWVQAECRGLSDADAPDLEVNPLLQRAADALRERPVLFGYCAEEVATARHTALFQRFIKALTRGQRPIEMHAHDVRRYISDMLAWVHTSLASERDFLISLFGEDGSAQGAPAEPGAAELAGPASLTVAKMLDTIFESICRPLKVRIEQVLMSSPPPMVCFRLSQLLSFYLRTIEEPLGANSHLADALRACKAMSLRTFHEQLKQRGEKLVRYPPLPPKDLSPFQQALESAQQLSELMEAYDASFDVQHIDEQQELDAALAAITRPLVQACERSAEALNPSASSRCAVLQMIRMLQRVDDAYHLDPSDEHVFMMNCLFTLQAPLVDRACAEARVQELSAALDARLSQLVAVEVARILAKSGLAEIADRIKLYEAGNASGRQQHMAADPALSLARVADAMRTFFGKLSDPAMLPDFPKLQVPKAKNKAVLEVARSLGDAYADVYAALLEPSSGYPEQEVLAAIKHTPQQVKTLLGVQ